MGTPREPKPAKYFVALLSSDSELLTIVESDLAAILGVVDNRSEILPWTASTFYEKEMGAGLLRRFLSFEPLASPGELARIKLLTQHVEDKYRDKTADHPGRRVNIDPGYIDAFKVALASTKDAGQRLYLHSGIYAEATLMYFDGAFHGLAYTYPDYLWPATLAFLTSLRSVYVDQLRRFG
jgi:hypothetical protein